MIREYRAPEDGVVMGKSVNPAGPVGSRIVHPGQVAAADRFVPREAEIDAAE